jgi:hypothetical protein
MKGYLQRMALSAITPGGSIRPMAGSVYSRPAPRGGPEAARDILPAKPDEWESHPVPGPKASSRAPVPAQGPAEIIPLPPSAPKPPARPALRKHVLEGKDIGMKREAPGAEDLFPSATSAARDADEGPPRAPRPGPHRGADAAENRPDPKGAALPPDKPVVPGHLPVEARPPEVVGRGPGEARERPFEPLVAGDFPPATSAAESRARPRDPRAPAGGRERAAAVPAGAPREPDEIQIHIGRIEVTAAPPPVLRPAAQKTQRKAPSLDDYLRRRNARIP